VTGSRWLDASRSLQRAVGTAGADDTIIPGEDD